MDIASLQSFQKGWTPAGSSAWLLATLGAPRGGEGSGGCVLSSVTSSRPSQWHWRRPLTTALNEVSGATCTKPHGDRRLPEPRPRTMLCGARRRVWPGTPSSSRCTRKNSVERGLTRSSRSGRRNGTSVAPWNRSSTTRSFFFLKNTKNAKRKTEKQNTFFSKKFEQEQEKQGEKQEGFFLFDTARKMFFKEC